MPPPPFPIADLPPPQWAIYLAQTAKGTGFRAGAMCLSHQLHTTYGLSCHNLTES